MGKKVQSSKVAEAERRNTVKSPDIGKLYLLFALCLCVFGPLCLFPAVSYSQTISGESVKAAVESYIKKSVLPSVETVIEFKDLKQNYHAPAKDYSFDVSSANSVNMRGPITFLVKVRARKTDETETIPVTVKIRTFQNIMVTTQTIQPHSRIESGEVNLVKAESTELSNPVTDLSQLKNKWTSRWIQNGKALTFDMFDDEPVVKRGDDVMIVVRTKNVVVREEGNAMQDGKLNDIINVMNEYKENLRAKVTGKGEVVLVN